MYLPYVNIKMGTKNNIRYSNGNALPLTQLPFAMASFCPQTSGESNWFYDPTLPILEGIRLTHQPSPWIGDYGTFIMMPQWDKISNAPSGAWSGYTLSEDYGFLDKENGGAILRPHYIRAHILRSDTLFELTPTQRGCAVRLTSKRENTYFSFLPVKGKYTYTLDKENGLLKGTNDYHSQDDAKHFKMYFAVKIPEGVVDFDKSYKSERAMHLYLKGGVTELKIGISYINHEQALLNLERECGNLSFDALKRKAKKKWESYLERIEINTDDLERKRVFYSCMYRAFLFPHMAYELDKDGKAIHYSPSLGTVKDGVRYTDTGFWDTSRTQFPLFSLIARKEFDEMVCGFVNDYLESGYLPRWISIGEVGCMPSTLIDGVIAEAACEGICSEQTLKIALLGMLHHANNASSDRRYGRNGVLEYKKYGYVPRDLYKESVNLTLDAAYGDWCIATVAELLGKQELYDEYIERSKSYKNIFDKNTGFMRSRDVNGEMRSDFDPIEWGGEYTEGSAWQNSFFVPHDTEGLCELFGGRSELIKKLDELFDTPPVYRVGSYGGEIHEMTEMASTDLGQCAISNQPSFHIPYLYAELGETEKCEKIVKNILDSYFSSTVCGFPGDEDNGSMASWYILSTLGMYKICPGKRRFITINPNVKSFKIRG